jgi:hypothetical protein
VSTWEDVNQKRKCCYGVFLTLISEIFLYPVTIGFFLKPGRIDDHTVDRFIATYDYSTGVIGNEKI